MKRIIVTLAFAALAAGCAKKAAEPARPEARRLETGKVERREEPGIVEVDGTVVGRQEAVLASRLAAPVVEVQAVPGQTVRAGEVLVRLEPRGVRRARWRARAPAWRRRGRRSISPGRISAGSSGSRAGAAAAVELERARQDEASAQAALAAARGAFPAPKPTARRRC